MIMNKTILVIFLIFGIILIVIALVQTNQSCPPQKTIYKYIPRTFDEEQEQPVYVSDIFKAMFTQPSPWNSGIIEYDKRINDSINQYFVSQK